MNSTPTCRIQTDHLLEDRFSLQNLPNFPQSNLPCGGRSVQSGLRTHPDSWSVDIAALCRGLELPEHETDQSPPSNALRMRGAFTSIIHTSLCRDS